MIPGPLNKSMPPYAQSDIAALTKYLDKYFSSAWPQSTVTVTATPSFPCTYGAQPGIFTGAADYCECKDGKFYPVSVKTYTTEIHGTASEFINACSYTTTPSKTKDLGTTIKPTQHTTAKPTTPTGARALPPGQVTNGASSCYKNQPTYYRSAFSSAVSQFCASASSKHFSASHAPGATLTAYSNNFPGGQAQRRYPEIHATPEDGSDQLYLQVKFAPEACKAGSKPKVDFKQSGSGWCKKNFFAAADKCNNYKGENPGLWGGYGGFLYQDCIEWTIAST